MTRLIIYLGLSLILLSTTMASADEMIFSYSAGRAEADGRDAQLKLSIDGKRAWGKLTAKAICKTGIRLPSTSLTFEAIFSGNSWENEASAIVGEWSGGDFGCDGRIMDGYPTEGSITISFHDGDGPFGKNGYVRLHRTASSAYGYIFDPMKKSVKPGKKPIGEMPSWIKEKFPGGKNTIRIDNGPPPSLGNLGPPDPSFVMPDMGHTHYMGAIALAYKESRQFSINPERFNGWSTGSESGLINKYISAKKYGHFITTPILKTVSEAGSGVTIKGDKEGVGRLWLGYEVEIEDQHGKRRSGMLAVNWLILVGDEAVKKYKGEKTDKEPLDDPPPVDIKQFTIVGKALRIGSGEPASGARLQLIPDWNQQSCKVGQDGSFNCAFTKQRSGTYEIMVQKPSGRDDLPTPEAADYDLWPIKRYLLDLAPEHNSLTLDVGTILMDRIGVLCGNENNCRDKSEKISPKIDREELSKKLEQKGDQLLGQKKYEAARKAYEMSKQYTNNAARIKLLDNKLSALDANKPGKVDKQALSGVWQEKSTKGQWSFKHKQGNRYSSFFKGNIEATGEAELMGQKLILNFSIKKFKVHYEMVFTDDFSSASGSWRSSDGSTAKTHWQRSGEAQVNSFSVFSESSGSEPIPWLDGGMGDRGGSGGYIEVLSY